jgi:hypothetical protein
MCGSKFESKEKRNPAAGALLPILATPVSLYLVC